MLHMLHSSPFFAEGTVWAIIMGEGDIKSIPVKCIYISKEDNFLKKKIWFEKFFILPLSYLPSGKGIGGQGTFSA